MTWLLPFSCLRLQLEMAADLESDQLLLVTLGFVSCRIWLKSHPFLIHFLVDAGSEQALLQSNSATGTIQSSTINTSIQSNNEFHVARRSWLIKNIQNPPIQHLQHLTALCFRKLFERWEFLGRHTQQARSWCRENCRKLRMFSKSSII